MDEYLTLENLLKIYEEEIRKNVKNKKKLYYFEKNKMSILTEIYEELKSGKFSKLKYNIFYIQEPKYRVVMSLNIKDKIINHFATRYILMPKLEKYLDMRNVATRKNMGSDYGIKLIKKYMNQLKNKNFYILKLDISKYFYSIDHDVLKSLIIKDLNEEEYRLICHIIDSSNEDYVYESIQKIQQKGIDVPNYERKKGLPIGNMTSQFLSVFFLHKLDHYIVHDLTISRYVKYMDDMILMHEDKEYLKFCLEKIEYKLKQEYQLKLNSKKTKIISCKEGFVFLGYHFKLRNKRLIVRIRKETKKKIRKNINKMNYEFQNQSITFEQYFSSMNNYYDTFKYGSRFKIQQEINSKL